MLVLAWRFKLNSTNGGSNEGKVPFVPKATLLRVYLIRTGGGLSQPVRWSARPDGHFFYNHPERGAYSAA